MARGAHARGSGQPRPDEVRVGVLGGGQLGRMLALAGRPLGLRFRFLEPSSDPPVAELGEVIRASHDDHAALEGFASGLDVVTYEFENVPDATARWLEGRLPVHPSADALGVARDRLSEKQAFQALGIPTASHQVVDDRDDLDAALESFGFPAVLKTRRLGYDGKGQAVLRDAGDVDAGWARLSGRPLIAERFVPFEREMSIVGVRDRTGRTSFYPLVENEHREGILRLTLAPAPRVSAALQASAEEMASALMDDLGYIGVLALELFDLGGELWANELAPRVHNSGHWTLDGAWCSQFENHLRAVCGFPLGPTGARGHSAMLNLIGQAPPVERLLSTPGVRAHLYEKLPRTGRKVGHVNVLGPDPETVAASLARVETLLAEA